MQEYIKYVTVSLTLIGRILLETGRYANRPIVLCACGGRQYPWLLKWVCIIMAHLSVGGSNTRNIVVYIMLRLEQHEIITSQWNIFFMMTS